MNSEPLLNNYQELHAEKKQSLSLRVLVGMAVMGCVAYIALTGSQPTVTADAQQYWLNQAKDEYNWNVTQVLEWTSVNLFINLAVSPLGDLYGIQRYDDKKNVYQFMYKFDFRTGQWTLFDKDFQCADIRFDKMGRMYLLDTIGTVYGPDSRTKVVLTGVSDFEVTVTGRVWAVSNRTTTSASAWKEGSWDTVNSIQYKMFASNDISRVALANDNPIFVNGTGFTRGYGFQGITDLSTGVDGSVWALSNIKDKDGNSAVLKWDPFLRRWYGVPGTRGIKIGAFNEVSAAVLDT